MTLPNAAYAGSDSATGRTEMTTPRFVVTPGEAQLTFRNAFNFEDDSQSPDIGFDGMVMEISINDGAFEDIVAAGGSFVTGGYNKTISADFGSSLRDRMAWSGLSAGTPVSPQYITTTVNLPASASGQIVRVRWIVATDGKVTADEAAGAWIDTIVATACTSAEAVDVSGRVTTPDGRGLRNASVSISDDAGHLLRTVSTGSFGYYRFENVDAGHNYIIRVASLRYRFATRLVSVQDELADINFVGLE